MGKKFKIADVDSDDKLFERLDSMLGDDPFDDLLGDDSGKKKKKKKKKNKEKAGDTGSSFKESLKALSKKELRAKCEEMGIDLDYINAEDKKYMRKAILKARKDARTTQKVMKTTKDTSAPVIKQVEPPYYFDETTRKFVVCDAEEAPDMTVFTAMRALGAIRRKKKSDDGFAELMERIMDKIKSGELDADKSAPKISDAIDVEYTEVKDEETSPKPEEKTDDAAPDSFYLEKFSKDVTDALNDLKKVPKKNGKK